MLFSWDANKDRGNVRKHGISLSRTEEMFDAPTVKYEDTRKNYGETRFICYGVIGTRVY